MDNNKLKLKDIEFNDVYDLAEVMKTLEISIDEKELENLEGMGIKSGFILAKNVIGNLKKSKLAINAFLGIMFGITGEEFGKLGLKGMTTAINQIADLKETGELKDFFIAAARLM